MEITAKKRPIEIQAYHFTGKISEAIHWSQKFGIGTQSTEVIYHASTNNANDRFYVKTLEGDFNIKMGDYIIRGIKGEFYICDKDIFESTYDIIQPIVQLPAPTAESLGYPGEREFVSEEEPEVEFPVSDDIPF